MEITKMSNLKTAVTLICAVVALLLPCPAVKGQWSFSFKVKLTSLVAHARTPLLTGRRFLWFDRNVSEALEANQSWLGAFRFRNELALGIVHVNLWIFFRLRKPGGQLCSFNDGLMGNLFTRRPANYYVR